MSVYCHVKLKFSADTNTTKVIANTNAHRLLPTEELFLAGVKFHKFDRQIKLKKL